VEEGVDVAVRIGKLADSALRAIRVGEVRRVLVASPGYLKANGHPRTVADLKRHQVIAFTGVSGSDEWRFGAGERAVVQVKPRFVVNSADAAIAAAEAGLGITRVLSYQVSAALAKGRLRSTLDEVAPPAVPISLLYQADRSTSPARRAFLDQAVAYFRSARL
jgi:DNA-binding transcriptional LysR family regulator